MRRNEWITIDDRALLREIKIDRRYLDALRRNLSRSREDMAKAMTTIADSYALLQSGDGEG
jgi:hypothetical protein